MRLPRQHRHLYQQVPYTRPAFSWTAQLLKTIGFSLIFGMVGLLHPFIRRRHPALASWEEYKAALPATVLVWVLGTAIVAYLHMVREYQLPRTTHQWVGRFPVRMKSYVLKNYWLEFTPDDTHRVPVAPDLYTRIQPGDMVEVTYDDEFELQRVVRIASSQSTG